MPPSKKSYLTIDWPKVVSATIAFMSNLQLPVTVKMKFEVASV